MQSAHEPLLKIMTLLVFAALTLAGTAAQAAAPDANVKGLWLRAQAFPADEEKVEVLVFTDDQETGEVTYTRSLDGMVTFEIRRQKIEDSELQTPKDVEDLIEMRVNNDDIDEKVLEENRGSIDVDTDASEFGEFFTYPCATAYYITGANEDTRQNASLFIFTDEYSFEVAVSMTADSVEDYEEAVRDWLKSLKLETKPADGKQ